MLEKEVEAYLKKRCEENGWMCLKFVSPSLVGVPDRIVITRALTFFVEVKKPRQGRLSEIQKTTIKKMAKAGAKVAVIRAKYEVDDLVREVKQWQK